MVRSRGVTYLLLEADRRPVRVAALLDVRTMSLRYAGHLPVCIPYDRTKFKAFSMHFQLSDPAWHFPQIKLCVRRN